LVDVLFHLQGELVHDVLLKESALESRKEEILDILFIGHIFKVIGNFEREQHVQVELRSINELDSLI